MGCEQAGESKLGKRGRRGWAGRKPGGPERRLGPSASILPLVLHHQSRPALISQQFVMPLPRSELPKWASPDPSGPHSGLRCRPGDGWPPLPWARLTTAGETWAGRGVKPGTATASHSPRPRAPAFPAAAGDAGLEE